MNSSPPEFSDFRLEITTLIIQHLQLTFSISCASRHLLCVVVELENLFSNPHSTFLACLQVLHLPLLYVCILHIVHVILSKNIPLPSQSISLHSNYVVC